MVSLKGHVLIERWEVSSVPVMVLMPRAVRTVPVPSPSPRPSQYVIDTCDASC